MPNNDIKDIIEGGGIKEPATVTPPANDEVTIPRSLLETLQKDIADLKEKQVKLAAQADSKEALPETENKREVRMRLYANPKTNEESIVVGYDKKRGTWKVYNQERREDRLMMDILVWNKDQKKSFPVTVDYNNFMENAGTANVQLIKVSSKPVIKELGYITIKEVIDYRTVNTPAKIMQKVLSTADVATIKLPDGEEMELDIDFINM